MFKCIYNSEQYEKDRIANRRPKEAEKIQEEKDCVETWYVFSFCTCF